MENRIYKTTDELSKILESRGIELDVDPVPIIQREGYYALINGYKEPFLDKRAMQGNAGDRYIPGTKFSHIYELFYSIENCGKRSSHSLRVQKQPYAHRLSIRFARSTKKLAPISTQTTMLESSGCFFPNITEGIDTTRIRKG